MPFLSDISDSVLTVDDLSITADQFANRIRFEHAYNNLQYRIQVHQLTQAAEAMEEDAANFIAVDPLVQRIISENNDPLLLGNRVLNDLTADAVVWSYIEDNTIDISSEDIDASIANFFNFTDQESDEREVTIDSFNQNLLVNGVTQSDVLEFYCRLTAYDLVQEAVVGDIDTTLYVDVDHILVSSEEVAQDIINLIAAGDDFATLAEELSLDVPSASRGGNIGEYPAIIFDPDFADAVSTGEIGTIIGPVQTQFGWHVIRINSREERPIEENWRPTLLDSSFAYWRSEQIDASTITINPDWQSFIPECYCKGAVYCAPTLCFREVECPIF